MRIFKSFLKVAIVILLLVVLYLTFIIFYNTLYDYQPEYSINKNVKSKLYDIDTFSVVTWNIGYAGLGEKMDFFYEGGIMVRPPEKYYNACLNDIIAQISAWEKNTDFLLLQEVDFNSKRSYYINQKQKISKELITMTFSDSLVNYKVPFVPFPVFEPMGKVCAGLVTFSKFQPSLQASIFFKPTYSWPKQIFFLDRGVLIHGYKLKYDKWLFVVNIHLSAFDDAQHARLNEMLLLKRLIELLVDKGNYVIVAGDWNINPPAFKLSSSVNKNPVYLTESNSFLFSENFHYCYDTLYPTNRMVNAPYTSTTPVTTLDYFLVSKNIKTIRTEVIPLKFRSSDHNPVRIMCVLE